MAEGRYQPGNIDRITPAVLCARHRCVDETGEQATIAGDPVWGATIDPIAAGDEGAIVTEGTCLVEAGAGIALGMGGGTYQAVMTDANGRLITYVAGQTQFGNIHVAATGLGHHVEVKIQKQAAPLA